MKKFFLVLLSLCGLSTLKAVDPVDIFPLFGTTHDNKLYIPISDSHGKLPNVVFAYSTYGDSNDPIEFTSPKRFEQLPEGVARFASCQQGWVYELKKSKEVPPKMILVVFGGSENVIRSYLNEKVLFEKKGTSISYDLKVARGSEGFSNFVRTLSAGKCIRNTSYYEYAEFEVEPSSEEEWSEAECGEKFNLCNESQ